MKLLFKPGHFRRIAEILMLVLALPRVAPAADNTRHPAIDAAGILTIAGKKVFPIGFTMPPPADGRTPDGKDAIAELHDAGANFLRTGVMGTTWTDAAVELEQRYQDAAARQHMHCLVNLRELGSIDENGAGREERLRALVTRFRSHPGMGVWKQVDEPEWGKHPLAPMLRATTIIRELDPEHPIEVTHAPRGTLETLRPYNVTTDIVATDIYPIGYPPGTHSLLPNKQLSMVGDYTQQMRMLAAPGMSVWMTLQIAWSGVIKPGKTLRMPTFPEQRFMTYQAIINGARGLLYFGGHIPKAMSAEDARLGWNWRHWRRVLRPIIEEIGEQSPLHAALLAPDSARAVKSTGGRDIEFRVREAQGSLFLLACSRGNETRQVTFSGLPEDAATAEVMFEPPRTVPLAQGTLQDWFAPFEVHVYQLRAPDTAGPPRRN
jgi:hypothetical protein